jgi:hypothetical protein
MLMIIEDITNNVRAVNRELALSPEALQQVIAACVSAVRDMMAKEARIREEQSVAGPWAMQPHGDR